MFSVSRLNEFFELEKITGLKNSIDHRLKPLGALGKIEDIALQMALIQNLTPKDSIKTRARHLIFAGDHGIAQNHSVSIEKSGFTTNLINSCLSQDAGINAFLKTQNIPLTVINSGVLNPNFIAPVKNCSLGKITKDFSIEDAMTETELNLAEKYSKDLISECLKEGITTLLFGEIGIGNTTSSAAIMSKALDISPEISTGPGTGIDKEHFNLKKALIKKALERHHEHLNARDILKAYGGYEIAEMTFTMLEAANNRKHCRPISDQTLPQSTWLYDFCNRKWRTWTSHPSRASWSRTNIKTWFKTWRRYWSSSCLPNTRKCSILF